MLLFSHDQASQTVWGAEKHITFFSFTLTHAMHTKTLKNGVKISLALVLFFFNAPATPLVSMPVPTAQVCTLTDGGLTITRLSSTSVRLDWSGWDGAGAYTVRVKDLSTGALVQQFSTANTTTFVGGLTPGVEYQVRVEKAGHIIIELIVNN